MTYPEKLQTLREALSREWEVERAATPGPWQRRLMTVHQVEPGRVCGVEEECGRAIARFEMTRGKTEREIENADLIVRSRTGWRRTLEHVERRLAHYEKLWDWNDEQSEIDSLMALFGLEEATTAAAAAGEGPRGSTSSRSAPRQDR